MDWLTREHIASLDKELAKLREEHEWLEHEYKRTLDMYEQAEDTVRFVWSELHSILPHFAERLADENPTLREIVE